MTIYFFGEPTGFWDDYRMPSYYELPVSYPQMYHGSWHPNRLDAFEPYNWVNAYLRPQRARNATLPRHRRCADSTTHKRTEPVQVWKRAAQQQMQAQAPQTNHVERPERPQSVETQPPSPTPSEQNSESNEQVIQYQPRHFEVDCSDFRPENIHVKVIDNRLVVEAQEEQRTDHGYVRMELSREFSLGDHFDLSSIKCRLTAQGSLHIEVPCSSSPQVEQPQAMPIQNTIESETNPDSQSDQTVEPQESLPQPQVEAESSEVNSATVVEQQTRLPEDQQQMELESVETN